jgi:putative mRNA 3-end processing factor
MMNMELKFLGGCREVGKSAILLNTGKEKFLLDYGIEVQEGRRPIDPPMDLDGVLITHAHIDHSGFVPALYSRGYQGRVFATPATFDIAHMLLEDSLKVQKKRGMTPGFSAQDIRRMGKREKIMNFRDPHEIGSSTVELLSAGHIPGAASVSVRSRGKHVFYTGDVKYIPTDLMPGADTDVTDVDVLISESTYSYKNHPDRCKLKEKLLSIIDETCHNDGITLLPAFAVGRTQELLVMLKHIKFPIYMDGMGIRATDRILSHPKSFMCPKDLGNAFRRAHWIRRQPEREQAVKEPCVIITTAGMLQGGPVGFYIQRLAGRKDCAVVLTGFMVEGTPGRHLLETGIYKNDEMDVKPQFPVHSLDFSAHTDRSHLIKFYKRLNPEKIFLVHGDRTQEFAKELNDMGFRVLAPKNDDTFQV